MLKDKLKGTGGIIINLFMMLFSFTCIFPIIWMLYSSLKTKQEFSLSIISLPGRLQFNNYVNAIKVGKMNIYFGNSLYNSIISVVLILGIAFVTGYFLSRYKFKGRNFIYVLFISGMLIPDKSLLIPIFVQFKSLGMLDKWFTLIPPYIAFGLPMAIFLIESFIKTIPVQIEEAAFMDGSTIGNTMFKIIAPICKPVLATTLILTFLDKWNEFSLALVLLRSEKFKTIPIGLTNFTTRRSTDYTPMLAALVIASLPVIILYLMFYKRVIDGFATGAVKG